MAKKEHFDGWFQRRFHKWADAIPIDRESGGKEALAWAITALNSGKIVSIYPEGTRTLNGRIQKGKTGVARLALAAKVPVLPIGLVGTFDIMPKGKFFPRFKRCTVNIGKLMYFKEYYGKCDDYDISRKVTDRIMKEIARLSNQEQGY